MHFREEPVTPVYRYLIGSQRESRSHPVIREVAPEIALHDRRELVEVLPDEVQRRLPVIGFLGFGSV
jgi:hypothetical protein